MEQEASDFPVDFLISSETREKCGKDMKRSIPTNQCSPSFYVSQSKKACLNSVHNVVTDSDLREKQVNVCTSNTSKTEPQENLISNQQKNSEAHQSNAAEMKNY